MPRRSHRSQLDAKAEINMMPLIDLMTFLLIVMFMIMPVLEYGTNVSPPSMNEQPLPDKKTQYVNVNNRGQIVINNMIVSREELRQDLSRLRAQEPDLNILLRADGARSYTEVIEVLKVIKQSGFANVSLVTQAESHGR